MRVVLGPEARRDHNTPMFNLGFSELLIIGAIALVFIGPKELPEIARVIGRMLNELRRATSDIHSTLLSPQEHIKSEFKKILEDHPGDKIPEPGEKGSVVDMGFEAGQEPKSESETSPEKVESPRSSDPKENA